MAEGNETVIPQSMQDLYDVAKKELPERLRRYAESIEESLRLDDFNLQEKAQVSSFIHHGFVTCKYAEKRKLKKLEQLKEQKVHEYVERYGKESGAPAFITKDKALESDEIKRIDRAIDEQRVLVQFLDEEVKLMSAFGFTVKNSVEMAKIS